MHPNLRQLSLLSIISLTLIGLAGCGEKRVYVSTASGAPGEEIALEPIDENSEAQPTGLNNTSVNETDLSSNTPENELPSVEPVASTMDTEPLNFTHEPAAPSNLDESLHSSLTESQNSEQKNDLSNMADPLVAGEGFSAQSSSSPKDELSPSLPFATEFQNPTKAETADTMTAPFSPEDSNGLQNSFPGEDLEPIPDTFQIAKAEPTDGLQDRLNQIKNEELAAAAAGLEDVFFQFDSWTLTQEGKQSLNRTRQWFEQAPSSSLIIEGHADQRGTQAYNMVLAKKRAVAVQEYLSQLGVDPSRMAVISYGKDKPFCQDATEVCHQLNRRGHLLIPNQ